MNKSFKMQEILFIVFVIIIILLLINVSKFIKKGKAEDYCLKNTLDKYGMEIPMAGEKWDYFTSCYDSYIHN